MAEDYTVEQGDCISSIAFEHGFFWETLWNHSSNATLKTERKTPNILMEGDLVHIPDLAVKQECGSTEKKHRFKRKAVPAKFRIRLLDADEPRAREPYLLYIDGASYSGSTDGDGWIEWPILPNAKQGRLLLNGGDEQYTFMLGHLDPIDQITGLQSRLSSLGL